MDNKEFVHLHLHTDYSLLDGAIQIKPLARRTAEFGMPACAMTDHGNMYGAVSFYNAMKDQGVKPIIGCETYLTLGDRRDRAAASAETKPGQKANFHLILLAKNLEGYRNLVRLTSKAYTEGFYYKPRIDKDLLARHSEGLIGLSACMSGVPSALLARECFDEAVSAAKEFEEILGRGNYFLEIQEHGLDAQRRIRKPLVELSNRTGVPLVATNDAHYLMPADARAHDVLLCIGSGKTVNDPNRLRYGSPNFYVRSAEEMWEIFGKELPEALRRTVEIAEMCDFHLESEARYLPNFPIPESDQDLTTDQYFEKVVREGYERRRAQVWDRQLATGELRHDMSEYQERISREIAMIKRMGFAGYFLIVWDFIRYAREHSIPVGPGRGSAAGSLVAYCLDITDIDPLQYGLLFERFLNPERVSMPDIDIDFCVRGRGEVIKHVADLYGRDSVCQIITFGTLASKAAIKDVGRALDMPYAEVDRIAKLVPPPVRGRNVSIEQALEQVPELRTAVEENGQVRDLIDLARRLEGCARHASVHAAGVVISPVPLQELVPVAVSSRDELTTQYAMSDLEKTGMLKMDFLALTALTVISDCLKSIKQLLGVDVDWTSVPLNDPKAMDLFAEGRTEAVFQFESPGMQEICRKLRPRNVEDLAALNALYRPGPLDGGMVDDFIERHHGHKAVRYIVPQMKEILSNTYGILVYQEQIMQLAQKLGGYSLGEADLMRRAMGKKNREEMAMHRHRFVQGAVAREIRKEKAEQIFSLMEQFADYGFNRSHSVAYAYLAFQTAYLKAHYPEHFYAAVLSSEANDSQKIFKYSTELRSQGIRLLPPDVNESGAGFTPLQGAVRFGLAGLKGVGQAALRAILDTRESGVFRSLSDFIERVPTAAINKRVMESLVCAGALDTLNVAGLSAGEWRARLFAALDGTIARAHKRQRARVEGQESLFGGGLPAEPEGGEDLPFAEPWSPTALLAAEKKALGFFITGHPLDDYGAVLTALGVMRTDSLSEFDSHKQVSVAGVVTETQVRTTKKGARFALLRLEDQAGSLKCVIWPESFAKYASLIQEDALLLVSGRLEKSDENHPSLIGDTVTPVDGELQRRSRCLVVRMTPRADFTLELPRLFEILDANRGECGVILEVALEDGVLVRVRPHGALRVQGSIELERTLNSCGYQVDWSLAVGV